MVGVGGAVGDGRGKSVSKKPNGYEKNYELSFVVFCTYYILSSSANLAKVAS